jgi:hypothetical protein
MAPIAMREGSDSGQKTDILLSRSATSHPKTKSFREDFRANIPNLSRRRSTGPDGLADATDRKTTPVSRDTSRPVFPELEPSVTKHPDRPEFGNSEVSNVVETPAEPTQGDTGQLSNISPDSDAQIDQTPTNVAAILPRDSDTRVVSPSLSKYTAVPMLPTEHSEKERRTRVESKKSASAKEECSIQDSGLAGPLSTNQNLLMPLNPIVVSPAAEIATRDGNKSNGQSTRGAEGVKASSSGDLASQRPGKVPHLGAHMLPKDVAAATKAVRNVLSRNADSSVEARDSAGDGLSSGVLISSVSRDPVERAHGDPLITVGTLGQIAGKGQGHVTKQSFAEGKKDTSESSHIAWQASDAQHRDTLPTQPSEHNVLVAMPTVLQVAIPGRSHGWLKIRAELAGDGAVHASMSAASAADEEALRGELPALTTYLRQEQISLGSLSVHATVATPDSVSMFDGADHGSAGGRQHADKQEDRNQQDVISSRGRIDDLDEDSASRFPRSLYAGSGGWLSVRA